MEKETPADQIPLALPQEEIERLMANKRLTTACARFLEHRRFFATIGTQRKNYNTKMEAAIKAASPQQIARHRFLSALEIG